MPNYNHEKKIFKLSATLRHGSSVNLEIAATCRGEAVKQVRQMCGRATISDDVVPVSKVTTFNCFLNGGELYCGSVTSENHIFALVQVADKLKKQGFENVDIDNGLEAVFFWAYETEGGLLWAKQPEMAHTFAGHFVSVVKSRTFEI